LARSPSAVALAGPALEGAALVGAALEGAALVGSALAAAPGAGSPLRHAPARPMATSAAAVTLVRGRPRRPSVLSSWGTTATVARARCAAWGADQRTARGDEGRRGPSQRRPVRHRPAGRRRSKNPLRGSEDRV